MSFCILNGSFRLKVLLKCGSGVYMYRIIGFGWFRVKWWNDLGNIYVRFMYNDFKVGFRYGYNWYIKVFVFWVVFMGVVFLFVYFVMRFDMFEWRRENFVNMCEGWVCMFEV